MFHKLIATERDWGATILRTVLGVVFFAHGAQKLLGWFGGDGLAATMGFFTEVLQIPAPLAVLAIAAEFFGGVGLLAGLLGRVAALGIASVMAVAAVTVHLPYGFFMNWTGAQAGEGVEYHLLALAAATAVMVRGSGAWSLDRLLSQPQAADAPRLAEAA